MSEAVSVAFGTELQDMPVLGPGEFPPPKILDAGQYKVTVSKARLLDKQDYKTVLIAMEELDSGAEIVSWIEVEKEGVPQRDKLLILKFAFDCFGVDIPDSIDEDGLGQLINKMGTVQTYVYEPKSGKPASNRVHRFLKESTTTTAAPKAKVAEKKTVEEFLDDDKGIEEIGEEPSWLADSD